MKRSCYCNHDYKGSFALIKQLSWLRFQIYMKKTVIQTWGIEFRVWKMCENISKGALVCNMWNVGSEEVWPKPLLRSVTPSVRKRFSFRVVRALLPQGKGFKYLEICPRVKVKQSLRWTGGLINSTEVKINLRRMEKLLIFQSISFPGLFLWSWTLSSSISIQFRLIYIAPNHNDSRPEVLHTVR